MPEFFNKVEVPHNVEHPASGKVFHGRIIVGIDIIDVPGLESFNLVRMIKGPAFNKVA